MRKLYIISVLSCIFAYNTLAISHAYAQDITDLGGSLTTTLPGRSAIQVNAPNVTDEDRRILQLSGFGDFHKFFTRSEGLGPDFVNSSCGKCHIDNGRGPARFSRSSQGGSEMVVKVSLPGLKASGAPKDVPGIGEQLKDQSISGKRKTRVELTWELLDGAYPDGTKYKLRRPKLSFRLDGTSSRKIITSLRMTPAVIGPGLLEAIPDSTIYAKNDPYDLDGDGISGKPNFVINARTGQYAIGRFGFKASHTTVEEQSAAALFNDIGISSSVFFTPGIAQELDDVALNRLVVYQKLAGVPIAQNQDDPHVISGKNLFQSIGCDKCHLMTVSSEDYADPELANQTFHPFTDLLLHDMGKNLADKRAEFSARGSEWKTTPLWGLGFSRRLAGRRAVFLHDGRARSIEEAVLWHGGEAAKAQKRFKNLKKTERADLLAFLDSL